MSGDTTVRERLGQRIAESEALQRQSLPLAVLASVVCTVLASAFGTGRAGTLLSAATGPLITALFTTHGRMGVRWVGIALVTLVAFMVTVTGFTVPELLRGGKSLIANRSGTFVPTEDHTKPDPAPSQPGPQGPAIATSTSSLTCDETTVSGTMAGDSTAGDSTDSGSANDGSAGGGSAGGGSADGSGTGSGGTAAGGSGACPPLEVRSVGTTPLQITRVEVEGPSAGEYRVTAPCTGALAPGASCRITVTFQPAGIGPRQAVLVVHQNLSSPANRITLQGTGISGGTTPPTDPVPSTPVPSTPVAVQSP